jgi:hypothetical protein
MTAAGRAPYRLEMTAKDQNPPGETCREPSVHAVLSSTPLGMGKASTSTVKAAAPTKALVNISRRTTPAMFLYVGISLAVQFLTRYGGCEVIAIQNLVYRKRCASYCVPLLPLDMAEKAIVDALARRGQAISEPGA